MFDIPAEFCGFVVVWIYDVSQKERERAGGDPSP